MTKNQSGYSPVNTMFHAVGVESNCQKVPEAHMSKEKQKVISLSRFCSAVKLFELQLSSSSDNNMLDFKAAGGGFGMGSKSNTSAFWC